MFVIRGFISNHLQTQMTHRPVDCPSSKCLVSKNHLQFNMSAILLKLRQSLLFLFGPFFMSSSHLLIKRIKDKVKPVLTVKEKAE